MRNRRSQAEQRYAGQQLKDEYKALGDCNIQVHAVGLSVSTSDALRRAQHRFPMAFKKSAAWRCHVLVHVFWSIEFIYGGFLVSIVAIIRSYEDECRKRTAAGQEHPEVLEVRRA